LAQEPLIKQRLVLRWSPERIAGWLSRQGYPISPKAVYKYIHSRGLEHLLWKPKKRKKHAPAYVHDYRKFTERKPVLVTGHWELDFVVCGQNTQCLLVAVDRYSRFTRVQKLPDRTKHAVMQALTVLACHATIHTVTTDNDIAFSCWRELEQRFGFTMYFTHPYRSWEKPLVEQTNQLIRRFIPKGTNLRTVSNRTLATLDRFLNHTPKQCLNYNTAYETHYQRK